MTVNITLSSNAVAHIQSIMQRHPAAIGFRLSVKNTGCSGFMYAPKVVDSVCDKDISFTVDGGLQVFIDHQCLDLLQGLHIDFVEKTLGVKQLKYINPNVDTTCGCGESFSLKESRDEHE